VPSVGSTSGSGWLRTADKFGKLRLGLVTVAQ